MSNTERYLVIHSVGMLWVRAESKSEAREIAKSLGHTKISKALDEYETEWYVYQLNKAKEEN